MKLGAIRWHWEVARSYTSTTYLAAVLRIDWMGTGKMQGNQLRGYYNKADKRWRWFGQEYRNKYACRSDPECILKIKLKDLLGKFLKMQLYFFIATFLFDFFNSPFISGPATISDCFSHGRKININASSIISRKERRLCFLQLLTIMSLDPFSMK